MPDFALPASGGPDPHSPIPFDVITFRREVAGVEVDVAIERSRLARLICRRLRRNTKQRSISFHGAIVATIVSESA